MSAVSHDSERLKGQQVLSQNIFVLQVKSTLSETFLH